MAVGTLVIELLGALLIAAFILWSYGNIPKATPAVVIGKGDAILHFFRIFRKMYFSIFFVFKIRSA